MAFRFFFILDGYHSLTREMAFWLGIALGVRGIGVDDWGIRIAKHARHVGFVCVEM
jgi:hypothetical protein